MELETHVSWLCSCMCSEWLSALSRMRLLSRLGWEIWTGLLAVACGSRSRSELHRRRQRSGFPHAAALVFSRARKPHAAALHSQRRSPEQPAKQQVPTDLIAAQMLSSARHATLPRPTHTLAFCDRDDTVVHARGRTPTGPPEAKVQDRNSTYAYIPAYDSCHQRPRARAAWSPPHWRVLPPLRTPPRALPQTAACEQRRGGVARKPQLGGNRSWAETAARRRGVCVYVKAWGNGVSGRTI
jgi:hypothetical protein